MQFQKVKFLVLALLLLQACGGSEEVGAAGIGTSTQELSTKIPDFKGLPGYYRRTPSLFAPLGEITGVWLKGKDRPGGGTYQREVQRICFKAGCQIEEGAYRAIPNNPMVGVAFISFTDAETRKTDHYIVDGILRNLAGQIVMMQLRHSKDQGPGLPFIVQRIW